MEDCEEETYGQRLEGRGKWAASYYFKSPRAGETASAKTQNGHKLSTWIK
jgi:hypothetical protein